MGSRYKLPAFIAAILALSIILIGCVKTAGQPDAVSASTPAASAQTAATAEPLLTGNGSTLIVYYSYTGTTQRVAEHLQALTGGTLYLLELADPYTGGSYDVSDRVFEERGKSQMPELSGTLPDLSEYDRVLIGTPVWNSSMANPILSYLQQTDFDDKVVAPFWTYITNQGSTGKDFTANIQNGRLADGLALRSAGGMDDEKLDNALQNWLSKLPASNNK